MAAVGKGLIDVDCTKRTHLLAQTLTVNRDLDSHCVTHYSSGLTTLEKCVSSVPLVGRT